MERPDKADRLRDSNEQLSLQLMLLSNTLRERSKYEREWFDFLKRQNCQLQEEITRQNKLIEAQNWVLVKALLGGSFGGLGLCLLAVLVLKLMGVL